MFSFITNYIKPKVDEVEKPITHYKKYGQVIKKEKICSFCGVKTTTSNYSNHRKTRYCRKVQELKNNLKIEN